MDTGLFEFVCAFVLKLSSLDTEELHRFIKIVVLVYFPRQTATAMRLRFSVFSHLGFISG